MQRRLVIKTSREAEASAEELYELRRAAFQQWTDAGLHTSVTETPIERFRIYLQDKAVFVAEDEATGELLGMHTLRLNKRKGRANGANLAVSPKAKHEGIASRMLQEEAQRLRKAGYRYMMGTTGIPATWSVRWHLKNGYYIVGYSRREGNNYASYIFRKQIAIDVRHHPTDLLWTWSIAPLTAKIQYVMYYLATNICKTRKGQLNRLGRMAKKILSWRLR
ncbi:MAG: GNAT family N-acetyltransferase [Prevotella sp.]|nr:GNAT family N-acetyltransferase [Prevotella sp.]